MTTERDIPVPVTRVSSTRQGAIVTIEGDCGLEFRARVLRTEGDEVIVRVFEKLDFPSESPLQLVLVQALPRQEKMALILEKATELGAHRFVPCISARSADPALPTRSQDKMHRWASVVSRAVEQSRRRVAPTIQPVTPFAEAIQSFSEGNAAKIILYEKEKAGRIEDLFTLHPQPTEVTLVCGPEGGFTEDEIGYAKENGFDSLRLGGRILRCETAAIAAISILQHVWGDL
jgi:16S rRNA (uracil1498-N3)-methyltransferase